MRLTRMCSSLNGGMVLAAKMLGLNDMRLLDLRVLAADFESRKCASLRAGGPCFSPAKVTSADYSYYLLVLDSKEDLA